MTLQEAITFNIVAIFCVAFLAMFLGTDRGGRIFGFFWGFAAAVGVSFWGWVIYVAAHFIGKYW
jgi:hypothetical protein